MTGRYEGSENLLDRKKKTFKIHHTTGRFTPKKVPEKSDFLRQQGS